jgi:simple sugar transport system permease protein
VSGDSTILGRYQLLQRAGGLLAPVLTAALAFLVGGLVIVATNGKAPWGVYRQIVDGAGLNWIFHPTTDTSNTAAYNLTQTLLVTTALILTGLAVSFAFRCGMFNIGGQGQYIVGSTFAVWVGSSLSGLAPALHVTLAIAAATLAGAAWAGIAGFLKATVGAHEVITTIMLNWTAVWVVSALIGPGGPLQSPSAADNPISSDVVSGAKLPIVWGDPLLQGLSIGIFVALGALVVYWVVVNRTTLGFGIRAVGLSPEAARYGGIAVGRSMILAMAVSGAFAGLAGALDILGWHYRLGVDDVQASQIGFMGIAVALLGRNKAVGVGLSALLFGALATGTSTRNLELTGLRPDLAGNLTILIQGLVVLFVGVDVFVLVVLMRLRRRRA